MRKYLSLLFAGSTFFWACTDVVETNIIEIDEEVFILGFISPENDSIIINVSNTLPSLGLQLSLDEPEKDIERFIERNAIVRIENQAGNSLTIPFLEEQLVYAESVENFELVPGENYILNVLIDDKSYSAQTNIPLENIDTINEEIREKEEEFQSNVFTVDVQFDDIMNQNNFYIVGAFLDVNNEEGNFDGNTQNISFDLEAFQTDNLRDGGTITASAEFGPALDFDENFEVIFPEQDIIIQVINADELLYSLLRSDYLNEINQSDPFIELSVFPNNIQGEGATGIFAGYRYFEKRIPLEQQ